MSLHKMIMRSIMRQDMGFAVIALEDGVIKVFALTTFKCMADKIASINPDYFRVYDINEESFVQR